MKTRAYSFGRFYDPQRVQAAVSSLLNAGIPREQIRVLSPSDHSEDRNGVNGRDQKRLAWIGLGIGLAGGLLVGFCLFVMPGLLYDFKYETLLAVVGLSLTTIHGITAGPFIALRYSRRLSGEHLVGPNEHGVIVTIHDGQEDQMNRAKDEFDRLEFAMP